MIHMIVTFFIVFQCISYYIYIIICFSSVVFHVSTHSVGTILDAFLVWWFTKKNMIPTPKSIVSCCFFFAALAGASIFINDGPIELAESSKVQAAPVLWRSC